MALEGLWPNVWVIGKPHSCSSFNRTGAWVQFCSLRVTNQREIGLQISRSSDCSCAARWEHWQPNCVAASLLLCLGYCCMYWFSDGDETRAFLAPSLRTSIQYLWVLYSLYTNTFNKTIPIHWKPTFHNGIFGTPVCPEIPCLPLHPAPFCLTMSLSCASK
jgi:hypothetical protein